MKQEQLFEKNLDDLEYSFDDSNWNKKNKSKEENKLLSYRATILSMRQRLDLKTKIMFAQNRIKRVMSSNDEDECVVNFSGGKDSTVLSHIISKMGYKIDHLYQNTRIEYPECVSFVKEWSNENNLHTITLLPEVTPTEIWTKYGYPMFSKEVSEILERIRFGQKVSKIKSDKVKNFMQYKDVFLSAKCCDYLKKIPTRNYFKKSKKKVSILGTTAEESLIRRLTWIRKGCIYETKGQTICNPIIFFTEKDIWGYAKLNKIRFADIYYKGIKRNGCYCCGFGCHLAEENNFQILQRCYPHIFNKIMDKWGFKDICSKCNVNIYSVNPTQTKLNDDGGTNFTKSSADDFPYQESLINVKREIPAEISPKIPSGNPIV